MNYITLNGQTSTSITGLLIQTLPPISKPLMRTEVEEIDGRDGDIITKLGYAAYDKEITIGLHGNFDINAVIKYFDSEGTVIFSNEPDKYYNYQIIDQIDFERLIRYRTATVTLHCQPFKYSTEESAITFTPDNLITFSDYTDTQNGLTVTAHGNELTISGTATAATEFYVPFPSTVHIENNSYTLTAYANGTNPEAAAIRLIRNSPSNPFGGTYVFLRNNEIVSIQSNVTDTENYKYIYLYIAAETMDFEASFVLQAGSDNSTTITNSGNTTAKPKITIYGTGTINLSLNGNQIFAIELGDELFITIDAAQMEAYQGTTLKNRLVTGDYDNFVLQMGENTIAWSGTVLEVDIENYSRWI